MNPLVIGLLVICVALLVLLVIRWIQALRTRTEGRLIPLREAISGDTVARLCLVWTVVYVIFLFFWLPQHTFYRLFYLPAIVLLVGWIISRYGRVHKHRLALFVAVMAVSNFLFSMFPTSYVEKNPPLALALDMNKVWRDGTVVYYATENTDNNLFQYFNRGTVWKPVVGLNQLRSEVSGSNSSANPIWLETSALDKIANEPGGTEWLDQHELSTSRRELVDRAYRIRLVQVVP
jgi:hypothetical protein